MNIDRASLKARAKALVSERAPQVYLVTLVYVAIVMLLTFLSNKISTSGIDMKYLESIQDVNRMLAYINANRSRIQTSSLASLVISIMSTFIGIGYTSFNLLVSRRQPAGYANLFDGFLRFFRFLGVIVLTYIFTFLWSLLFIIPGIVAAYRYRMATYLVLTDPDITALGAISKSKELMRGHKWELFVLDLSFIGWALLCGLTFGILYIWKGPYFGVTYALYFSELTGYEATEADDPDAPTDAGRDNRPPWEL